MTNADQPAGQDVEQETGQELVRRNGHDLLKSAIFVISPKERNLAMAQLEEAVVGDGDTMGIASQIAQNLVRSCERRLGLDDPVMNEQRLEEIVERSRGCNPAQ